MSYLRRCGMGTLVMLLVTSLILPSPIRAQTHVVSPGQLQQDAASATRMREANLARVQRFFSSGTAQEALKSAGMNGRAVQNAVRTLDADELARLAAQADKAERDFAAGQLNNQQITYVIIALATAVLILIIVVAD